VVQRIEFSGISPELQQRIQGRLTLREGDTLEKGSNGLAQVQEQLQQIDEHLVVAYTLFKKDPQPPYAVLWIMLRSDGATPVSAAAAPLAPGVYRIGGGVSAPVPTLRIDPEYSEEARKAKWQGAVLLQVTVNESGVPQDIKVVRPLGMGLDQKAIEAVQQWRFKPGLKDGNPVPVSANIEVNFRLLQTPEQAAAAAAPVPGAVTVGEGVMNSRIVSRVPAEYPSAAKLARVQGAVQFSVIVGPDGKVQNVQYVSGPAILVKEATDSVRQWVYQPYLLNGQPVTVHTIATVNFVLQ
jgi:TonB family protein